MSSFVVIPWPKPFVEALNFASLFLAAGAVGFRYSSLHGRVGGRRGTADRAGAAAATDAFYIGAARRAALLGAIGGTGIVGLFGAGLPAAAIRKHTTVAGLLAGQVEVGLQGALGLVALVGFALAARGRRAGWPMAAVGVVGGTLHALASARFLALVNPLHMLAGGFWIGTLFVVVVAGLVPHLRDTAVGEVRGGIAADMVNAFSPLAVGAVAILVVFGVVTAWRHLNYLSALWTTPYGYALLAKLAVAGVAFALGAWNWRRQRPRLGSADAAHTLVRSARAELAAAAVVLAITAILVTLPVPKR
ncbi:MAG: hypothetical protein NVS1B4_23380 [Gemmatimonadaceae bacterium]